MLISQQSFQARFSFFHIIFALHENDDNENSVFMLKKTEPLLDNIKTELKTRHSLFISCQQKFSLA